jgi:hypothetical protein
MRMHSIHLDNGINVGCKVFHAWLGQQQYHISAA